MAELPVAPATVVDVGAGDGRVTEAVVGEAVAEIHLVEPSAELLRQAGGPRRSSSRPSGPGAVSSSAG
jgi:hypothetical protein